MAGETKKTWITEAALVTAALAVLEPVSNALTNGAFSIPDPFDKLVFGVMGVLLWFLRARQKKAEA